MKRLILFLILLVLVTGNLFPPAFADREMQIAVDFSEPGDSIISGWKFPYADEWFTSPAEIFNRELAKGSLGLTVSAFSNNEKIGLELQYETYLSGAGFKDIHAFGYDIPRSADSLAGVIAHRKIGEITLIAVAARGFGYGKEWAGNLDLGEGTVHAGFRRAARILEDELDAYLARFPADGPVRIWISGFSRSAAIGNLAASDWIASGNYDAVYAYLFACPRVTKDPKAYPGIFNIIGTQDCIPQIPMQTYGYERNGKDLFLPSMETVTDFAEMRNIASETSRKLYGKDLIVNPENNLMLRLFIGFMARVFPEAEEYEEQFLNRMFETNSTWNENESVASLLPGALYGLTGIQIPEDRKFLMSTLGQLSSYLLFRFTGIGNSDDIRDGYWDPNESAFVNIVREHKPSTYITWVFSALSDEKVFRPAQKERIIFIGDCEALTVSRDGEIKWTLKYGTVKKTDDDAAGWVQSKSSTAIVILPTDDDYTVSVDTRNGSLQAFDVMISPDVTMCNTCNTYANTSIWNGAYIFTAHEDEPLKTESCDPANITVKQVPCETEHLAELVTIGFEDKAMELFESNP